MQEVVGEVIPPRNEMAYVLYYCSCLGTIVFIVVPAALAVPVKGTKSERIALEADAAMIMSLIAPTRQLLLNAVLLLLSGGGNAACVSSPKQSVSYVSEILVVISLESFCIVFIMVFLVFLIVVPVIKQELCQLFKIL